MSLPRLLLTLLLPPLSVYLRHGAGGAFWLNSLLTLLFYVPGVLHAVWLLRRTPTRSGAPRQAARQTKRGGPQSPPPRSYRR